MFLTAKHATLALPKKHRDNVVGSARKSAFILFRVALDADDGFYTTKEVHYIDTCFVFIKTFRTSK
jgi:hypothetical protein